MGTGESSRNGKKEQQKNVTNKKPNYTIIKVNPQHITKKAVKLKK
jgi:hypothetical protein